MPRIVIPFAASFVVCVFCGAFAAAAEPRTPEYLGPDGCLACHTKSTDVYDQDLVLFREKDRFLYEDKHAKAYELLQSPLGQRICRTLSIDLKNLEQAKQCLSCHANWVSGAKPPDHYQLGVSCESCHGPSSEWDREHRRKETWRPLAAAEKEAKGFVNVREPRERANQCLSCHIGEPSQGKVITHAMYAAGHPPLPGIELESFSHQMPRHWRYVKEKGNFDLKAEYVRAMYSDPAPEMPQTKSVLVGGVAVLRHWLALVAHNAAAAKEKPASWPELAHYDCQACHHDLKTPSWRQARLTDALAGPPGRPDLPEWTCALVRVSLGHLAPSDETRTRLVAEFDTRLVRFRAVLKARPFGDPAAVAAAAEEFAAWLENVSQKLSATAFDRAAAKRDLARLLTLAPESAPDFQSARQLAWAAKTIAIELVQVEPVFAPKPAGETPEQAKSRHQTDVKTYDAWHAAQRAEAERKIDEIFERFELNERLKLQLPAGQKAKIDIELPANLAASAAYDPVWFRKAWGGLGAALAPKP